MDAIDSIKIIFVISIFFSLGMNLISYTIPDDAKVYLLTANQQASNYNMTNIKNNVEGSYTKIRTGIPLIDIAGSLVFSSGNIFLDLIMNFALATPSLISLIIGIVFSFFPIDVQIITIIKVFIFAVFSVIYFINMIVLAINAFSEAGIGTVQ